jgi:hypothetical protein
MGSIANRFLRMKLRAKISKPRKKGRGFAP